MTAMTMSNAEFGNALVDELKRQLPSEYTVTTKVMMKSNDTSKTGIIIAKEEDNGAVIIYVEDEYPHYQEGFSIEEIAKSGIVQAQRNSVSNLDLPEFNKEFILGNAYFRPANREMNQKRLQDVPVYHAHGADDIDLYPCMDVDIKDRRGVIIINNETLDMYDLSVKELHEAAIHNTEERLSIGPLDQLLQELVSGAPLDFSSPFLVAVDKGKDGNSIGVGTGGASIFGAPSKLAELEGTYYIIPSSIYEALILPEEFCPGVDRLFGIVRDVNRDVLKPEDKLSDSVYRLTDGELETLQNPLLEAELKQEREA